LWHLTRASPAQAFAYKTGQLKFRELRDRAQREQGAGVDIQRKCLTAACFRSIY
jgi:hypothetical protein